MKFHVPVCSGLHLVAMLQYIPRNMHTVLLLWENQSMYNHNKAQQSKNRVHISWDILNVKRDDF